MTTKKDVEAYLSSRIESWYEAVAEYQRDPDNADHPLNSEALCIEALVKDDFESYWSTLDTLDHYTSGLVVGYRVLLGWGGPADWVYFPSCPEEDPTTKYIYQDWGTHHEIPLDTKQDWTQSLLEWDVLDIIYSSQRRWLP